MKYRLIALDIEVLQEWLTYATLGRDWLRMTSNTELESR